MCVRVCVCLCVYLCVSGKQGPLFLPNICKIYESRKNMARLWAGLSFHTSTGGSSTPRGNAPSSFCPNSLRGFGQIPSLGLLMPVCKVRDITHKRAFSQGPGGFMPLEWLDFRLNCRRRSPSEGPELSRSVQFRGPIRL